MSNILHIIWIAFVAFVPMVIWGYVFSYLDNSVLNARRFLAGMLAGGIAVVPVLYFEDLLSFIGLRDWSVFSFLGSISGASALQSGLSVGLLLLLVAVLLYIVLWALFFERTIRSTSVYFKNFSIFLLLALVFGVLFSTTGLIGSFTRELQDTSATFGKYVFSTFQTVLLYYIIVGILEEVSKHFSFLGSSFIDMESLKKWALLSVFIALGFGFVENILYLSSILSSKGLGSDLVTTWIFRSIFSVFVHVFCGMIVVKAFGRAQLAPVEMRWLVRYIQIFFMGILASIIIHAIYDIGLTFGFTAIIFVYLVIGYLYCTRIFHAD